MPDPISLSLPGTHDILRAELPNGIVVLARENFAAESVVLTGSLESGSIFERLEQSGLSGFTASSLMRGTRAYDFDAMYETLENMAARLAVSGNTFSTIFSAKSLAEDLPTLLQLTAEALLHPVFPVDQTERLRGELMNSLKIAAQSTRAVSSDLMRRQLYSPDHPYYAVSALEQIETLRKLALDDLKAFHARHYGPRGMIVVVVGAVKAEEAVKLVEDTFGNWSNPDQPALPAIPEASPLNEIRRQAAVLPGKTQVDVSMGWVGPRRTDPDYQAVVMANSILGAFGMMGRLGAAVREREGFAYYAASRYSTAKAQGPWSAITGVSPKNAEEAIRLIVREIERITTEPVSESELADNKANFTGSLPLALESNEGVAGTIHSMENYRLGLDYLYRYRDLIEAITVEDVLKAAQHYLNPRAFALGIAGPEVEG